MRKRENIFSPDATLQGGRTWKAITVFAAYTDTYNPIRIKCYLNIGDCQHRVSDIFSATVSDGPNFVRHTKVTTLVGALKSDVHKIISLLPKTNSLFQITWNLILTERHFNR